MKNILLFIAAALILLSCQKQQISDEIENSNIGIQGLKYGEVTHTLFGGQTIPVGTVTVGITGFPNDGIEDNIYVYYSTLGTDWYIKETHVHVADDGSDLPTNNPGNPRIGKFDFSTNHSEGDGTQEVTYPTVAFNTGTTFAVATHAVVYNTESGQEETAWGKNEYDDSKNHKFSGKRWGWFQDYSWDGSVAPTSSILYFTQYDEDGNLIIFQYNLDTGQLDIISQEEFLAGVGGSVEGASWDSESNMFVFISEIGNELWVSDFDQDAPSSLIGGLPAIAVDGTFIGNTYYFIDENNNIWAVTIDSDFQTIIGGTDAAIGSLNDMYDIIDIAVSPDGQMLYIVVNNDGVTEILTYNLNDNSVASLANLGSNQFQIAFNEEGDIQVIEETVEEDNSIIHDLNENTGEIENSNEVNVDVEDVTTGPII